MRKHLLAIFLSLFYLSLSAQISYYNSIEGVVGGAPLKNALHKLIKTMHTVNYGSGANSTWDAFYVTDVILRGDERLVGDMYSPVVRFFGTKGEAVSGMNIEHCVPKSWWGGTKNNAYEDLHHLNPSDETANNKKNNYPMAQLGSVSWSNGSISVGKAVIAGAKQNAFEPADEYKGDFARTYMYMFTCYQNLTWEYTWMNYKHSAYPTLKPWAAELLLKWHRQDPVSEREIARNNAIYAIQGNRNPYIDYPCLADFVWGDSVGKTFRLCAGGEDGTGRLSGRGVNSCYIPIDTAKYSLVTDASSLSVGDTIIIASGCMALGINQKAYNRARAVIETADNEIAYICSDVQKIVLEKGTVAGTFAFNVGNGYLYAASSTKNSLRTQNTVDANASWLIIIDAGAFANIVAQGGNECNLLRYNNTASLFACYKNGQTPVNIYAKHRYAVSATDNIEYNIIKRVDVYNIAGVCVRRQVSLNMATAGLPKGLYIVNSKKCYVK